MKKYISLLLIGGFFVNSQAQETTDALRLSLDNLNGTARFRAMSGAFGALGGDLSAISVNPAGSAVFNHNQAAGSISSFNTKTDANYFGKTTPSNHNALDINQAGAVFVFKNWDKKSDWTKFSVAINYENAANLSNKIFTAGTNPSNSLGNYFLAYANQGAISTFDLTLQPNESVASLYSYLGSNFGFGAQQAFLGYNSYVIDPASDYNDTTNRKYISLVRPGGNYYQENTLSAKGYNGKLSFNAAASYKDRLYVGLNLNSHFTDFRQKTTFFEQNSNPTNTDIRVRRMVFENELYTYGNGFSFQLGVLGKITNEFRAGLAYESPTWFHLNDEFTQSLTAISADNVGELNPDVTNPRVTNIYDPYSLKTAGKWTGSLAYVFQKKGLLSLDYAIKDYSSIQFGPKDQFSDVNNFSRLVLNQTSELRIGGEYKIEKWSLRGGYRTEQSPYKDKTTLGDLKGYSAGFGYNWGATKLDLSYAHSERNSKLQYFSTGFTDSALLKSIQNNITVTLTFEL